MGISHAKHAYAASKMSFVLKAKLGIFVPCVHTKKPPVADGAARSKSLQLLAKWLALLVFELAYQLPRGNVERVAAH